MEDIRRLTDENKKTRKGKYDIVYLELEAYLLKQRSNKQIVTLEDFRERAELLLEEYGFSITQGWTAISNRISREGSFGATCKKLFAIKREVGSSKATIEICEEEL